MVEVDGFTYKRRRVPSPSVPADENATPNAAGPRAGDAAHTPAALTPRGAGVGLSAALAVRRYLREHLALVPGAPAPADALAAVAASVGEAVLDGCAGPEAAEAAQAVLQMFLLKLRAGTATGRLACEAATGGPRGEAERRAAGTADRVASLAARKAGLRARLSRYQQVCAPCSGGRNLGGVGGEVG